MKKVLFCVLAMIACTGIFAQQPVVAVAPFSAISGISTADANMITRVFFIRLGNTNKVSLVDRNVVERVLQEHKFQAGDWSNQQKTAELGEALNANWIVRGEMEKFGSSILVTVQFYDIRTFQFKGGADLRLANAEEAYDKIDPLVNKLVETIAENPTPVIYKIGDRGPGDGFIFFAENGVYMECSMDLGSYDWESAMRVVRNYKGGGFNDWRLPSLGELELMYKNLKQKGLGGFGYSTYWSSSQSNISGKAHRLGFAIGKLEAYSKNLPNSVRAVRQF